MKKISMLLMFVMLALPLAAMPAFAGHHAEKRCEWTKGKEGCSKCCQSQKSGGCPILEKFMKKAHFFLENQTEIGLSEEQVTVIKKMKVDMKKKMIRNKADMQIHMLDMKAKLHEPIMDVAGINAMIDESMAQMAASAKAAIASLAELKGVLTAEQMEKAKEIWKSAK